MMFKYLYLDSVVEEPIEAEFAVVVKEEEQAIEAVWAEETSYRSRGSRDTAGNSTYLSSTVDENPYAEYTFYRLVHVLTAQGRAVEEDIDDEKDKGVVERGKEGDESEEEREGEDDDFDALGHGPAPRVTVPPLTRKPTPAPLRKPSPLITAHGPPINASEHRKKPMKPSMHPPSPPKYDGITGVTGFRGTVIGATPVEDFEINRDAPPTVPLDEQVTLGSFEPSRRFSPRYVQEDYTEDDTDFTTGPAMASSTYGENRRWVSNQILLDPYGDRGSYTGVVLLSSNMPHGSGTMLYEDDGRTYDGEWRHGRWHGWGQATFSNGHRFEGFYKYDQRHGQGKYEWRGGLSYEGEFKDDKREGKGHFIWPDGADYVGDFKNGRRHGYGVYKFSHGGGQYKGEWVNGFHEGYGECSWKDGRMYKGEWKAGMAHGQGTEWYPDGRVRHSGQWFKDDPLRDDDVQDEYEV